MRDEVVLAGVLLKFVLRMGSILVFKQSVVARVDLFLDFTLTG